MSLKFCANLSFMYQETSSLLERYVLAHKSGFNAVECANPYDHSLEEIVKVKVGLKQVLINTPVGDVTKGELGYASLPNKEEIFAAKLQQAVTYAKGLECKIVHIMSGLVVSTRKEHDDVYERNLKHAASVLESNDLIGVIEPINPYSVPNYYMNNYETAIDVIKRVGSKNLKLLVDVFHLQQIKGNLTRNLKELYPFIGHIQIAQVPNRNEPNTAGEINYQYILRLIQDLGYSGWIGLEYTPISGTDNGLNWFSEFKYSIQS